MENMSEEVIFPHLGERNIPHILTKILLFVNYYDELTRFRLVSGRWRDFIDHEMVNMPNLKISLAEKDFVDAWTKRPPKKSTIRRNSNHQVISRITRDHVFIRNLDLEKLYVCKEFAFMGYVGEATGFKAVVHCNENFVDLRGLHSSKASVKIKAYVNPSSSDPLLLSELPFNVCLAEMEPLALRSVNEKHLFLICTSQACSKIVLINLIDESVKRISVSRIDRWLDISWHEGDQLVIDSKEMVLFKAGEGLLHFIDHEKGQEGSTQNVFASPGWRGKLTSHLKHAFTQNSRSGNGDHKIAKSPIYTAILTSQRSDSEGRHTVRLYSNRTDQLVNSFSIRNALRESLILCKQAFFWSSHVFPFLHVFNVREGRLTSIDLVSIARSSCYVCSNVSSFIAVPQLIVIRSRVLIATMRCGCEVNWLLTFDLRRRMARVLAEGAGALFDVDVRRGRVLWWCEQGPCFLEVMDVGRDLKSTEVC